MLQLLTYFALISVSCIIWGLPAFYGSFKRGNSFLAFEKLVLSFFIGLSLISIFSAWISLFFPVRIWILIPITFLMMLLQTRWVKKTTCKIDFSLLKETTTIEKLFLCSCLLLFLFLGTGRPTMQDSDLYHIQNIKWSHEYGTVKGIANLYLRYGFYSNWFYTISLFQLPFPHENFIYLNFTVTVWTFLFLFHQYKLNSTGITNLQIHLKNFYFFTLLFMLFEWDLFRVSSSSTSYDFVITACVLISIHLFLKKIFLKDQSLETKIALLILLLTTPFYKLNGFLITPLLFFLFISSKKKVRALLAIISMGSIALIPFVVKNYLQSGYIFFPYQFLDFFYPDWKVPSVMVSLFNRFIYLSNLYIRSGDVGFSFGSFLNNYNNWFLHIPIVDKTIVIICLLSIVLSWPVFKKFYKEDFKKILLLYLTCVAAIIVWFLTSPDVRFVFGFLIFVAFFPLSILIKKLMVKNLYGILLLAFIAGTAYYIYMKENDSFDWENILFPKSVDVPPYQAMELNGKKYNIPEIINDNWNSRCFDCPLPCIYEINPYLRSRGSKISDGFKMKPYPDSTFMMNYRY